MNKQDVAKGFAWNAFFSIPAKVLFPLLGIYIARKVGVEGLGVFAIVGAVYAVADMLREGGLGNSYIADPDHAQERERLYAGLSLLQSAVLAAALLAASGPLAGLFGYPELQTGLLMVAVPILISGAVTVPWSQLQRAARFRDAGLADTIATAVSYAVALVLAMQGWGYISLVWQIVVRSVLFTVFVLALAPFVSPSFAVPQYGPILRQSMANLGSQAAYMIYTTCDYMLIGRLLGKVANGAYYVAFNLGSKPMELVAWPFARTMFVAQSRATDQARRGDILGRTLTVLVLMAIPFYVWIAVYADDLIGLLFGKGFEAAGPVLSILCLYLGARMIGAPAGNALVAVGRPQLTVYAWIPAYLIGVVGLWALWGSARLESIVWVLTAGAVATYATLTAASIAVLKPGAAHMRRVGLAALYSVGTAAAMAAWRFAPMPGWVQLVAAMVTGGLFHMAVLGKLLLNAPGSAFNKGGFRRIAKAL